jgi:hypothetical protein
MPTFYQRVSISQLLLLLVVNAAPAVSGVATFAPHNVGQEVSPTSFAQGASNALPIVFVRGG